MTVSLDELSEKSFTFDMTAYEQIWPVAEDHSDQWVYEELTPIDGSDGEP